MFTATPVTFLVAKIRHFAKEKCPKQHDQGFQNSKKISHSQEKGFEITKILGGFGRISSFLLLKSLYLANRF
jgi:hypothetical protein